MKRIYSVSRLLVVFLSVCVAQIKGFTQTQTTPLSFTAIPYSNPDFARPGAGIEDWHGWNTVNVPVEGTNTPREDFYYRFNWNHFETTQGNYTWTVFDNMIKACIAKRQKFSFGIMTVFVGSQGSDKIIDYDNGYSAYPQYLHNMMQAESVKDWKTTGTAPTTGNGCWIPNWNSQSYLNRLMALHQAINSHIMSTSYNGVNFKDVINYIDVRGYGNWGEWHSAYIVNSTTQYPAGTFATSATLKRIIDIHTQGFPSFPLVILFSAYDANRLGNTMVPPDVSLYALTATNAWGKIGWRRDNWGAQDTYIRQYTDQNTTTVSGVRLDTAIMNRYKYAPVVGEPNNGGSEYGGNCQMWDLENQMRRYHASSFGNGNMNGNQQSSMAMCWKDNVRAAAKAAGYRILLEGGSMSSSIQTGSPFAITLNWKNVGIAPEYYTNWNVVYELRTSNGTVAWSGTSKFKPRMFLPLTTATANTDNFTVPTSVAAGNYSLHLIIKDASGYKNPLPLAINGRTSDGSYLIRSVTVTTGSATANIPPVANAGANRSISLPTSSTSLDGTGSTDADGTIVSYAWQQVSGPLASIFNLTNIVAPIVSSLIPGTYTYRLTVTDNAGATDTDEVTVTVGLLTAPNVAPVANAGADRSITLPTNWVGLNGSGSSDPDGTIVAYLWQQISGPSTSNFSSTSVVSPTVSGLVAGAYAYRLRVTDNAGATDSDTVRVTVAAATAPPPPANQPPVANAGADRSITLPTNSVGLNGSGSSDPDGTIVAYLWQQISGPSTSNFSSTSVVSPTVSGLVAGAYAYRLRVTDNAGATDSDTVRVTVAAATAPPPPANQPPVANAGADRSITLPTNSVGLNGSGSSDPDGTIVAYLWQQISGPSTSNFSSTSVVSPTVSGLVAGAYAYRLRVTDNAGATDSDTVRVTVAAATAPPPPANQPPVANAGADRSITLPTNSVGLNGSGSSDPDGTIAAYLWQQISGPSTSVISSASAVSPTMSSLVAGIYYYRLRVTDNNGATDNDTVRVTVNPAVVPSNQAPVANAGPDRNITLPTNSVSLNGSGSSDPDGTISAYLWQQISGPSTSLFSATNIAVPTVSTLIAGTYYYRLRVTDNAGATDYDTVRVIVRPAIAAPNVAPIANAGNNQTVTTTSNIATLDGTESNDPDGTISSYLWQQISGPSTASMSNATLATLTVSNLVAGDYYFTLTVMDNRNTTDVDTVRVSVVNNNRGATGYIYPNPATANINVSLNVHAGGRMKFVVYDMTGRIALPIVFKDIPQGNSVTTIDVSRLKPGTYLLEVVTGSRKKMIYKFQKR